MLYLVIRENLKLIEVEALSPPLFHHQGLPLHPLLSFCCIVKYYTLSCKIMLYFITIIENQLMRFTIYRSISVLMLTYHLYLNYISENGQSNKSHNDLCSFFSFLFNYPHLYLFLLYYLFILFIYFIIYFFLFILETYRHSIVYHLYSLPSIEFITVLFSFPSLWFYLFIYL